MDIKAYHCAVLIDGQVVQHFFIDISSSDKWTFIVSLFKDDLLCFFICV